VKLPASLADADDGTAHQPQGLLALAVPAGRRGVALLVPMSPGPYLRRFG